MARATRRHGAIDAVMLHVRGGGNGVIAVIAAIADAVNGRALDLTHGTFLTGAAKEHNGWQAFQAYRDHVHGGGEV